MPKKYQPIILPYFLKQFKLYSKKYRHIKDDVIDALEYFDKKQGSPLGKNVYKIRIKTRDIPKGKSKSFRLIVLVMEVENFIVPIVFYFKGDRENIDKKEIGDHLEVILFELKARNLLG